MSTSRSGGDTPNALSRFYGLVIARFAGAEHLPDAAGGHLEDSATLLDAVEASILHLSLVGFALPLCLSQSYDLVPGAPTSRVIPSNNPAHQGIYQTCVMITPIL